MEKNYLHLEVIKKGEGTGEAGGVKRGWNLNRPLKSAIFLYALKVVTGCIR